MITIASKPLFLKDIQKYPPDVPSPQIPVSGDIPVTEYLPEEGLKVPVTGPVANINGLISSNGSSFNLSKSSSLNKSYVNLALNPVPPK